MDKLRKKPHAGGPDTDAIGDEFAALQPVAEEQPAGVMFGTVNPEPAT